MCTGEDSQRTRVYLYAGFISTNGLAEPTTVELSDGTLFTAFQGKKLDDEGLQRAQYEWEMDRALYGGSDSE